MSRRPASGKHQQHDPPNPGAPAKKRSGRRGASRNLQDIFHDLDEERELKQNLKKSTVLVNKEDCKVFHTAAQNAELQNLARWASEDHRTPPNLSTYDLLAFQSHKIWEYEKIAKGELTTPRESLDGNDQRILDELQAYAKRAAQAFKHNIHDSKYNVTNEDAAEAIKARRAELKKKLLAGEEVEDKLSECREIVRTFDFYVLRPEFLTNMGSTILWEGAHARDWATPLGEYITRLNKIRTMSPEDVFPKAKKLIEESWGIRIDERIKKIMDDLKEERKFLLDQPQPILPKQEGEDSGGHWVQLETQLERLKGLRKHYIELDKILKSKPPLTAPNKLMVSCLKAFLVKQAKAKRVRELRFNNKKKTPREIIRDRVRAVAGNIEYSEERKHLIDMMCQFGDRVGEEDMREIAEETLCFETLVDVAERRIQAEYVNELMETYRKRFPDTAWLYPADIVLTA